MVALDPVGNVSLIFNVVILFLLIMGLPLIRGANTGVNAEKNFIRHGYLTVVALVLETALIFIVMVPSFLRGLGNLSGLSILDSANVWSHVVLGDCGRSVRLHYHCSLALQTSIQNGVRKDDEMDDANTNYLDNSCCHWHFNTRFRHAVKSTPSSIFSVPAEKPI